MKLVPYMLFNGNAEEAIDFYGKIFDTSSPNLMRYKDAPQMEIPEDYEEKILHAEINFFGNTLYISDNFPGEKIGFTNAISFNLGVDSDEDLNMYFKALSEGGTVIQPIEKQFWGAKFGSLTDQFGVHWSLNYQLNEY